MLATTQAQVTLLSWYAAHSVNLGDAWPHYATGVGGDIEGRSAVFPNMSCEDRESGAGVPVP